MHFKPTINVFMGEMTSDGRYLYQCGRFVRGFDVLIFVRGRFVRGVIN